MEKQFSPKPSKKKDTEKGDQMDDQKWEKGKDKRQVSKHEPGDWKEWSAWQLKGIRLELPPPDRAPPKPRSIFSLLH